MSTAAAGIAGNSAKLMTCVLRDDGMDRRLLKLLHEEHGVTRADSLNCRAVDVLEAARSPRNKVPDSALARVLNVVVDEAQADAVFDLICSQAGLTEPGSGSVYMMAVNFATPLVMPPGVPDELGTAMD